MAGPPTADEWQFVSGFSTARRDSLEAAMAFEAIAMRIVAEARVTVLPVEHGREGDVRGCRRPLFHVAVQPTTFDQFYNGRDGYRARFWQAPDIGDRANRWLLQALTPPLVAALTGSPSEGFVTKSLAAGSATVWMHEPSATGSAKLRVAQWEEAARGDSTLSARARDGRWAAEGTVIEVRGAFLTDNDRERPDPEAIERSMTLHLAGYA